MLLEEVLIYTKLSICSRLCMNPINSSLVVEGWRVCPDCGRICGTSTAIMPFTQDSEQQNQTPSRARMPWTQRRPTEMPMWFFIPKITGLFIIFVIFGVSLELAMTSHKSANDPRLTPPKKALRGGKYRNSGSETPSPSHQKITYIHIRIPCRLRPITNKQSTLTAKKLYYPFGGHLLSHIIHPWGNLTNIKHLAKGRSLCWAQLPLHISPTKKRLVDGLAEGPINPYPPENLPQWHQYLYTNKIIMYIYSTVHTIITRFPLLIFTSFQLPCFFFVGISMDAPGLHTNFPL